MVCQHSRTILCSSDGSVIHKLSEKYRIYFIFIQFLSCHIILWLVDHFLVWSFFKVITTKEPNSGNFRHIFSRTIVQRKICLLFPLLGSFVVINLKKPQTRKYSTCESQLRPYFSTNPTFKIPLKNPTSSLVEVGFKWVFGKWDFSKTHLKSRPY